jgi:tRNA G18 (ribose-2'-O)-methylase SpoU
MKSSFQFSKRKFLSLAQEQQHKKCAELLREIYLSSERETLLAKYAELSEWLDTVLEPLYDETEMISHRFHWHQKRTKLGIREESLLPNLKIGDKTTLRAERLPVSIYLDHIRSAHNVGSILRTTEAFALGEILFTGHTPRATHPQVLKTAMGAAEHLTCRDISGIEDLPRPIIALELTEESIPYNEFHFPAQCTLALGNEEFGCSKEILKAADHIIEIPLYGRKNSLNVANAYAIIAAEISSQARRGC